MSARTPQHYSRRHQQQHLRAPTYYKFRPDPEEFVRALARAVDLYEGEDFSQDGEPDPAPIHLAIPLCHHQEPGQTEGGAA